MEVVAARCCVVPGSGLNSPIQRNWNKRTKPKKYLYQSVTRDDRGQRGIQPSRTGRFLPCARPGVVTWISASSLNASYRRVRGQDETAQHSLKKPTGELSQLNPKRGQLLHLGQADFIITALHGRSSARKPVIPSLDEPKPFETEFLLRPNLKIFLNRRYRTFVHEPPFKLLKRGLQT
ncbi:hypothetical protein PDO_5147, partial [Rhizobium sp. PDO1-076]